MSRILSDLQRGKYLVLSSLFVYTTFLIGVFGATTWQTGVASNPIAKAIINGLSGAVSTVENIIQKTIVNGFSNIITTITSAISTLFGAFFQAIGNIITGPIRALISLLTGIGSIGDAIYNGIIHVIHSILTGPVPIGGAHVAYSAIIFIVVIFVWLGFFIIQSTDLILGFIPVASGTMKVVGEIFIMLGATLAVYGTDPQDANIIFGGAFFLILLAAIIGAVKQLRG